MELLSQDQNPLPDGPDDWDPPRPAERYVLDFRGDNFEYAVRPVPEPPLPNNRKSRYLDIRILHDVWIEIELADERAWHWAMSNAITTGERMEDPPHLFRLQYQTRLGWRSNPNGQPCRVIRFGARRIPGPPNTPYAFNMNIELENDDGVVPITIDPDIRNPGTVPIERPERPERPAGS